MKNRKANGIKRREEEEGEEEGESEEEEKGRLSCFPCQKSKHFKTKNHLLKEKKVFFSFFF